MQHRYLVPFDVDLDELDIVGRIEEAQ